LVLPIEKGPGSLDAGLILQFGTAGGTRRGAPAELEAGAQRSQVDAEEVLLIREPDRRTLSAIAEPEDVVQLPDAVGDPTSPAEGPEIGPRLVADPPDHV